MKKLLLGFTITLLASLSTSLWAQPVVTVPYFENFDSTVIQATSSTTYTGPLTTYKWDTTSLVAFSSPRSMFTKAQLTQDTIDLITNSFSTQGNSFCRLEFYHIAKLLALDQARLSISVDNGVTWTPINGTNSVYLSQPGSPAFPILGYFAENSYAQVNVNGIVDIWQFNQNTTPTNAWWVKEVFDISTLATGPNGLGYPNVRLKFSCAFPDGNNGNPNRPLKAGWFVDDITITLSTCELYNPVPTWNLGVTPAYNNQPIAGQFIPGDYPIGIRVADNVAADSVALFYRVNFGPWQVKSMIPDLLTPANNRIFRDTIFGLNQGDTIDYYTESYDTCFNMVRLPSVTTSPDFYRFWIMPPPPGKCTPGFTPGNPVQPFIIYNFPFEEGFNNVNDWVPGQLAGAGGTYRGTFPTGNGKNWTVVPGNNQLPANYAWAIMGNNAATPQLGSGPSGSHSGSGYIYTWGERGASGQQTILETPCMQLPNDSCMAFEFYYHMYGSGIGTLRVEMDTNQGPTSTWFEVWSLTGEQHPNKQAPYTRGFIDLKPYTGNFVKFRFRLNRPSPNQLCDVAIDELRVYNPNANDAAAIQFLSPVSGSCAYSANEPVTIRVQSFGCDTLKKTPVAYNINGGVPVWDTLQLPLPTGAQSNFTFAQGANLTIPGTYTFKVWTAAPNDNNALNDTIANIQIIVPPSTSVFPILNTFEETGTVVGNIDGTGNYGSIPSTVWQRSPNPAAPGFNNAYAWGVGNRLGNNVATGPFNDQSNYGNFLFTKGNFVFNQPADLNSICLNFTGMSNPILSFFFYMHGSDIDSLSVRYLDTSNTWRTFNNGRIINNAANNHTNSLQEWRHRQYSLAEFANGGSTKLQIRAWRKTGGTNFVMALDNLHIYNQINQDAGVVWIQPPGLGVPSAGATQPQITIRNYGIQALTSIPIQYSITPYCGPNANVPTNFTATWTGTLQPGQTVNFNLPAPTWITGQFKLCAKTNIPGDINTFNDEWCKDVTGFDEHVIPFFTNFDDCNHDRHGFFSQGGLRQWELGTPASGAINSAQTSPNAWITGRTTNYRPNSTEILRVPSMIGFDTIRFAELRFAQNFVIGTGHAGVVEYETSPGQFSVLGELPTGGCSQTLGVNWYCTQTTFGTPSSPIVNGSPAFTGNTGGWINSAHPLTQFNFSSQPLNLRFRFRSNASGSAAGWAIDNFEIYVPPQNSASPTGIRTITPLIIPEIDNQFLVRITNTGAKRLDSCKVRVQVGNNAPMPEQWVIFTPPLEVNQSREVLYDYDWVNPITGNVTICAYTSLPNNKTDDLPTDDTLCVVMTVLDEIDITTLPDTSYCNDFDTPGMAPWAAYNAFTYLDGTWSWEFGSPNQAPITSAFSGTNAWMTGLSTNYKSRDSSALFSPVFLVDSTLNYEIRFMHNFRTEPFHDGGVVEASQDGGANWRTVGQFTPQSPWYNQPYITGLELTKPGFTGISNGWIPARIVFGFQESGKAIFRFRFGSDQNIEFAGWAIDDFCFETTTERRQAIIGLEEEVIEEIIVGEMFPNPSNGLTRVPIYLPKDGKVKIEVINMLGQVVYKNVDDFFAGRADVAFDVSSFRDGAYIVNVEFDGTRTTKKLIVNKLK